MILYILLFLLFIQNINCYNILSSNIIGGEFITSNPNSYLQISNLNEFNINNFTLILNWGLYIQDNSLNYTLFSYEKDNNIFSIAVSYDESGYIFINFNFKDVTINIYELYYSVSSSNLNLISYCDGTFYTVNYPYTEYSVTSDIADSIYEMSISSSAYIINFMKNNLDVSSTSISYIYIFNTYFNGEFLTNLQNSIYNQNFISSPNLFALYEFNSTSDYIIQNLINSNTPLYITTTNSLYIDTIEDIELQTYKYNILPFVTMFNISSYSYYYNNILMINSNFYSCYLNPIMEVALSINPYVSTQKTVYQFLCMITETKIGEFPIYLSVDNGNNFVDIKQNFNVIPYTVSNNISSSIINNILPTNIVTNLNSESIYIYIGVGASFTAALFLYILYKIYPIQMSKFLTKIDVIDLSITNDDYIEYDMKKSKEIELGPRKIVNKNSSVLTGITTISTVIFTVFLSYVYLYQTISNNEDINTVGGLISNGNDISSQNSYINITTTFKNMLFGDCLYGWESNIDIGNMESQEIVIDNIKKNCIVTWSCKQCQPDIINGINLIISNVNYNVFYEYLTYEIDMNGYNNVSSSIVGNTNYYQNKVYSSINGNTDPTIISVNANPTVYQYYNNLPLTGFSLDYQGETDGNLIELYDYNQYMLNNEYYLYNSNTNISVLIGNLYYYCTSNPTNYCPFFDSTISVNYKITRNPSYIFITVSDKNSILQIIAAWFALVILPFTIMRLFINIITKRPVRKFGFRIFCMRDKVDITAHTNKFSTISVMELTEVETANPINKKENLIIVNKKRGASVEMIIDENGVSKYRDSVSEV